MPPLDASRLLIGASRTHIHSNLLFSRNYSVGSLANPSQCIFVFVCLCSDLTACRHLNMYAKGALCACVCSLLILIAFILEDWLCLSYGTEVLLMQLLNFKKKCENYTVGDCKSVNENIGASKCFVIKASN